MAALLDLKQQGKIRAIGACNATTDHLRQYAAVGPLDADQELYSMLDRTREAEQIPYCHDTNVAVLAYSPLGRGLLTGKIGPERTFGEGDHRATLPRFSRKNREKVAELLDQFRPIAEAHGVSLAQFAGLSELAATLYTLAFIAFISLYYGLAGWLIAHLRQGRSDASLLLLMVPAVWVLLEWLRGWLLTGFPWLVSGYALIDSPLAGYAPLLGVYGLSWVGLLLLGLRVSHALLVGHVLLVLRRRILLRIFLLLVVADRAGGRDDGCSSYGGADEPPSSHSQHLILL